MTSSKNKNKRINNRHKTNKNYIYGRLFQQTHFLSLSSKTNRSSIDLLKNFARSYANQIDGSNLLFSIALIACRETFTFSPNCACDNPTCSRSFLTLFFNYCTSPYVRLTLHITYQSRFRVSS